jgi:L-lactate dehydrogenase complex protein LldE
VPAVALFVTCMIDTLAPEVGVAAVRLLERAGCTVSFPAAQTCCGQPAMNSGEPEAATVLARHFLDVFDGYDAIVSPSGSCAAMVHHWYERVLDGKDAERARRIAARTFELTQYLVDELNQPDVGARVDATVTVHDACHGLRLLGVKHPARTLLEVAGATLIEMAESEACCGFGGTFAAKHPEMSIPMADGKLSSAHATGARWLVAGDTGCLLHLAGRQRRIAATPSRPGPSHPEPIHPEPIHPEPIHPEPIHIAELLAANLV